MDWKSHMQQTQNLKARIAELQRAFELSGNDQLLQELALLKVELAAHSPPIRFVWRDAQPVLDKFSVYQKFL